MNMDWPYFTLVNGKLVDEHGAVCYSNHTFESVAQAEKWLEDNDERGTVRYAQ